MSFFAIVENNTIISISESKGVYLLEEGQTEVEVDLPFINTNPAEYIYDSVSKQVTRKDIDTIIQEKESLEEINTKRFNIEENVRIESLILGARAHQTRSGEDLSEYIDMLESQLS